MCKLKFLFILFSLVTFEAIASWKTVYRTQCDSNEFQVEARFVKALGFSGRSRIVEKFSFKQKVLEGFEFEVFYNNLDAYKPQNSIQILLNLQKNTSKLPAYENDRGPTLYLDPSVFSKEEFLSLANCLKSKSRELKNAFDNFSIQKRSFLWLFPTTGKSRFTGVARLVYSQSPFIHIFGDNPYLFFSRDGNIYYSKNYVGKPNEYFQWIGKFKNQSAELSSDTLKDLNTKLEYLKDYENKFGESLKDLFKVK